ncbi:uncharacterized protein LOC130897876 [Diorhabda carinulata]|uniref:uncharacterized protein LOC130897876 n=1 Tax=Diorhabda carinulata TaxID=1163345 RepID=UPI0025A21DAE|nr:uncharacterized protein LOC130897876 [Diorhabda carinulata]
MCLYKILMLFILAQSMSAHPATNQTLLISHCDENKTNSNTPEIHYRVSLAQDVLTASSNASGLKDSCSHCFMGHRDALNTVYGMLANEEFMNYSKSDESCSRCFKGLENGIINSNNNKTKMIGCMCGLFISQCPDTNDIPLRTKAFHNVTCHEVVPDEDACKKVCMFAALFHNELEPANICSHLDQATNITVYVESKICQDDTVWVFTGLASSSPACCNQGTAIDCPKI